MGFRDFGTPDPFEPGLRVFILCTPEILNPDTYTLHPNSNQTLNPISPNP